MTETGPTGIVLGMKAAIASLMLVVTAGTAGTLLASDPDRPSLYETKQDPVSAVRGAVRKLKVGMAESEVMKALGNAKLPRPTIMGSFVDMFCYKLDDAHVLVLEFNHDDSLSSARLLRGKEAIESVEK